MNVQCSITYIVYVRRKIRQSKFNQIDQAKVNTGSQIPLKQELQKKVNLKLSKANKPCAIQTNP